MKEELNQTEKKNRGNMQTAIYMLVAIVLVITMVNQYNLMQTSDVVGKLSVTGETTVTSEQIRLATPDVVPKGIPAIYGQELGISYDDVSPSDQQKADATIRKLALKDVQMTLEGEDLERYIAIASQISCEYCCGAQSIIFADGNAACGCAHSYAMRGLAKYLIKNHGTEFTDDQILEEMGKWKTLFFPDMLARKAAVLGEKGIQVSYVNMASNTYRGIENEVASSSSGQGGQMVGGC